MEKEQRLMIADTLYYEYERDRTSFSGEVETGCGTYYTEAHYSVREGCVECEVEGIWDEADNNATPDDLTAVERYVNKRFSDGYEEGLLN